MGPFSSGTHCSLANVLLLDIMMVTSLANAPPDGSILSSDGLSQGVCTNQLGASTNRFLSRRARQFKLAPKIYLYHFNLAHRQHYQTPNWYYRSPTAPLTCHIRLDLVAACWRRCAIFNIIPNWYTYLPDGEFSCQTNVRPFEPTT